MTVNPLVLSVTPINQDVSNISGSVTYDVLSNTAWSVNSDQSWCTVTLNGTGNGILTANYDENTTGLSRVAQLTITVAGLTPVVVTLTQEGIVLSKTLNLILYIEGLFNGTNMNKAQNSSGLQFAGTVADQVIVELHNSTSPYALVGGPYTVDVKTDGSAQVTIPGTLNSSYYVVVHHRNSIETWTGLPLSFIGPIVNHDFSTSASQAFGNNLKLISGKYVLYTGDINQDGVIDAGDMVQLYDDAINFVSGYVPGDLNGDGLIDSMDMIIMDNNAAVFVVKVAP
jgi:hypothetical protein